MRWCGVCSYDGTGFAGWQTQNEQSSIQATLEEVLSEIAKQPIAIVGSGRTDTGVHALAQSFHFDLNWSHGPARLVGAMSSRLPKDIQMRSVRPVEPDFNARYAAVGKRYQYRLSLGEPAPWILPFCWPVSERLDLNRVAEAMRHLIGEYDFAAFAANPGQAYESTIRRMDAADLLIDERGVMLEFEASGFLYKMVRSLVGTLVNVGLGKLEASEISRLLTTRLRTPLVFAAPARGLFLKTVFYS